MTAPTREHPALLPKRIPTKHYLAKDLTAKFSAYTLADSAIDLHPDSANVIAFAHTFDLSARATAKLGRRQNTIEAAVAPLRDASATQAVQKFLDARQVPKGEDGTFYALDVRRRLPGRLIGNDAIRLPSRIRHDLGELLTFEHEIGSAQSAILHVVRRKKKLWFDFIQPQGVLSVYWSKIGMGQVNDEDDEDIRETETYPADPTQNFAACYSQCIDSVPDWAVGIVVATCGTCTAALGATLVPGIQPASVPVLITACVLCAAAVGGVIGNCMLTCHEML